MHLTVGTPGAVLLILGLASASFSPTQYALIYVINMRGRATGVLSIFIGSSPPPAPSKAQLSTAANWINAAH